MNQTTPTSAPVTDAVRAQARLFALVPCAGVGSRAGTAGRKQYEAIAGHAVVAHTLAALKAVTRIERTMVVLSAADDAFDTHVPGFEGWVEAVGGDTRALTVARGLARLRERGASADDWVLVHDAARCLVRPEWIDALIDECLADQVGGLLAWPVSDTLKRSLDRRASATVDRDGLWQAQTPQMFRLGMLQDALRDHGHHVTDEAGAIQSAGLQPLLVRGSLENFKVTYPMDFELADRLLRSRP